MRTEKRQLQAAIRAAFKDVAYPGDDRIGDPEGRDDAENIAEGLRGVEWRSLVSKRDLGNLGLYFMTPEASHYYLPAYLLIALRQPGSFAMRGIQLRLRPYDGPYPYPAETFNRFVSLFAPQQKQVIRDFLPYAQATLEDFYLKIEARSMAELEEGTEADKERRRAFFQVTRDEERAEFDPLIEFWSRA